MNRNNIRQKMSIAGCALIILACQSLALSQNTAPSRAAKIDEVMTAASKHRLFNGSVLVAENGKVIYKKGLGMANMEWNIPNAPDTRFRLGSITKQFTAALVLQLVEQGKIKLDGKLSDYLPAYRKDVGEKVTIHQLLNHTSGIPSYTGLAKFMEEASRNSYTVDDFVKKYASNDLEFEPGSKFAYNNSGYFLLGAIIEKVTGKTYEQALKEQILDPLGMKNTGYDLSGPVIAKRAAGYVKTPNGYRNAPYLDMSIPYAAGSMYSTVEDLYLWDQALYTDRVVTAQSKDLMFKPALSDYAYGWVITKANLGPGAEPVTEINHGGGIHGFNTSIARLPVQKHLIVLLDNTSQGGNLGGLKRAITSILFDKPYTMPKPSVVELMAGTIRGKGVEAGIAQVRDLKTRQPNDYDFNEGEINMLGYQFLQAKKVKDAIEVFKLNVELFPKSANTYDSLAEAYMNNGDSELAIANYKKTLELDANNAGAVAMLKRLENKGAVDTSGYDAYVGEYDAAANFKVSIFKEGDKLMTQLPNQQAFELYAEDKDKFFLKVVAAKVSFTRDDKGAVSGLVIHQNGREMPAKKIK